MDYGKRNNNVAALEGISDKQYESIFNVYQQDEYYFYNILQCIHLPDNISSTMYTKRSIEGVVPLTTLSYDVYGDIKLWWLICLANNINDPTKFIASGTVIKLIKPAHVNIILKAIQSHLSSL